MLSENCSRGVDEFSTGRRPFLAFGRSALDAERVLGLPGELVLGDEGPAELAGAFLEEVFEGAANVASLSKWSLPN
jgi:hypothetical protein